MKQFSREGIANAKQGVHEALLKLSNLKPTNNFNIGDIRQAKFYLEDYLDELEMLERERNKQ